MSERTPTWVVLLWCVKLKQVMRVLLRPSATDGASIGVVSGGLVCARIETIYAISGKKQVETGMLHTTHNRGVAGSSPALATRSTLASASHSATDVRPEHPEGVAGGR
jgi:hypothetical protein